MKRRSPVIDGQFRVVGVREPSARKDLPRWFKAAAVLLAAVLYLTMLTMRATGDFSSPEPAAFAGPAAVTAR